jgi:ABC-type transport system involved in multi-copper enzyme maturation permease subunit
MTLPPSGAVPRAPTLVGSTLRVFDLSLGQMLWSRRSAFLAILLGGPVLMAAAIRLVSESYGLGFRFRSQQVEGGAVFAMMMWLLYVRFIIPVLGVFYGTSLVADEVEDKTITYLFTRPMPKSAVLLGKYLAYLVCTVLLVLPSVVLSFFLVVPTGGGSIAAAFPSLMVDLGVMAVGLTAYGAVFAMVGTHLKRPLVIGLAFVLGWEPAALLIPGYLKRLTVAFYLQGLVTHEMPQDSPISVLLQVVREVPSTLTSLSALALISLITLGLAAWAVERREYVLEQ